MRFCRVPHAVVRPCVLTEDLAGMLFEMSQGIPNRVRSVPASLLVWRRYALTRRAYLNCTQLRKQFVGHTPTSIRTGMLRHVPLMLCDVVMIEAHQVNPI